jgi:5'-methylthioadenosine phosphorylase
MRNKIKLAFIGGTGLYDLDGMEKIDEIYPDTPWGKPSDKILIGKFKDKELLFSQDMGKAIFYPPLKYQMQLIFVH